MNKLVTIVSLLFLSVLGHGQDNGYFGGFQLKSMIQSDYFNGGPNENTEVEGMKFTTSGKFGYTFGMTVRKKFNKTLAVESGLRFVQRNFSASIDSINNGYNNTLDYRLTSYEIPLKGMVSLRASKNSYFSVGLGVQLDLYPSNVQATNNTWRIETHRKSWAHGSLLANAGWEIMVKDVGIFYAGFSYTSPFGSPFTTKYGYNSGVTSALTTSKLSGNYFALDLRYYFNEKESKKKKE